MTQTSRQDGKQKEQTAAAYLKKKGYKIIDLNYSSRFGEIDIVAASEGACVFVEVRCRRRADFVSAEESVDETKKNKIIKTACVYIKEHRLKDTDFRFDVIAFSESGIEHYENAFEAEGIFTA